jgi:hypothetical protein
MGRGANHNELSGEVALQGQRRLSVRDETREAAATLLPQIVQRIEKAIRRSEIFPDVGDELIGMVKNGIYLVELSYSQAAGDGGGTREAEPQPAALRLVGAR